MSPGVHCGGIDTKGFSTITGDPHRYAQRSPSGAVCSGCFDQNVQDSRFGLNGGEIQTGGLTDGTLGLGLVTE